MNDVPYGPLRAAFPPRVVETWLQEFGYKTLADAVAERPTRIRRELMQHGKRLADRQCRT